jgi:hypothetical protein
MAWKNDATNAIAARFDATILPKCQAIERRDFEKEKALLLASQRTVACSFPLMRQT